jgi:PIN domain nuclease of toxin-antitoxin system
VSAFVVDTNALLFYAGGKGSKLGKAARAVFEKYERGVACLYVPVPVVIETWMLAMNGTLRLATTLDGWWAQVESEELVQTELTRDDVLRAASLEWDHTDVFDRLIVATALRLECPLVTKDSAITDWGGIDTLW